MFVVEIYAAVRKFVFIEGHSRREAARVFGLNRETVLKMCRFSLPPGYTRTKLPEKPKLGPLLPVIDAILEADRDAPMKQRHSAKRIFERLRDEHGFLGGYTVVKDHVRICRARGRETFVPLSHPPGHGQVDFGEALALIGGVRQKIHFFCLDLPQSDACFVKAYPRETTEAFLDGHVSAFAFFGGVPLSLLYDNTKIAVAKICGDGKRDRTRAFTELVSHCLFQDRFGRPGKGNDKGKVEGAGQIRPRQLHDAGPHGGELRGAERHAGAALPRAAGRACRSPRHQPSARSPGDQEREPSAAVSCARVCFGRAPSRRCGGGWGMQRQTLRDWVHRYNTEGLAGLLDCPKPKRARQSVGL